MKREDYDPVKLVETPQPRVFEGGGVTLRERGTTGEFDLHIDVDGAPRQLGSLTADSVKDAREKAAKILDTAIPPAPVEA